LGDENRGADDPLEGGGADEPFGVLGHQDPDAVPRESRKTRKFKRLVGGDPTAYAEQDSGHRETSCLAPPRRRESGAVLVFELALGKLFKRHGEVIPLVAGLDHRRRVLTKAALAEVVEVAVYLSCPLGRDDDCRVMGVGVAEELVNAWSDHSAGESR